uniref:Lysine-specific demethylase n=1 Tax=Gopherus evgoodei TaxID=1825980 RepID=A0A8C4YCE4_9SAUR
MESDIKNGEAAPSWRRPQGVAQETQVLETVVGAICRSGSVALGIPSKSCRDGVDLSCGPGPDSALCPGEKASLWKHAERAKEFSPCLRWGQETLGGLETALDSPYHPAIEAAFSKRMEARHQLPRRMQLKETPEFQLHSKPKNGEVNMSWAEQNKDRPGPMWTEAMLASQLALYSHAYHNYPLPSGDSVGDPPSFHRLNTHCPFLVEAKLAERNPFLASSIGSASTPAESAYGNSLASLALAGQPQDCPSALEEAKKGPGPCARPGAASAARPVRGGEGEARWKERDGGDLCGRAGCDAVNSFGTRNEMPGPYRDVDGALGGHGIQRGKVSTLLPCPPRNHHTKLKKTWLTRHSEQFRCPASCLGDKGAPGQIKEGLPLRFKALKREGQESAEEADQSGKRTAKRPPAPGLKDMEEDRAAEANGRQGEGASARGHRILFGPLDSSIALSDLPLHPTFHPLCSHTYLSVSLTPPGDLSLAGPSSSLVRPVHFALSSFLIYPLSSVAGNEGSLAGDLSLAKYLLSVLGDQFCEAIRRDREAWLWARKAGEGGEGREETSIICTLQACDACQHGLFNTHWSCSSCGFQLCLECYRTRRERASPGSAPGSPSTSGVAVTSHTFLSELWKLMHEVQVKFDIESRCPCRLKSPGGRASVMSLSLPLSPPPSLESPDSVHPLSKQGPTGTVQTSTLCELLTSTAIKLCLGQNGVRMAFAPVSSALPSDNRITNILDSIIAQVVERKIQEKHSECELQSPSPHEPQVSHCILAPGGLLWLHDPNHSCNYKLFQEHWRQSQPVLVSGLQKTLKRNLWEPESFCHKQWGQEVQAVNLRSQPGWTRISSKDFWNGFASKCLETENSEGNLLKLESGFGDMPVCRAENLCASLPLLEYCGHDGKMNLASYLPGSQARQWLTPQICAAYGVAPEDRTIGTKNLTVEATDSISVLVYVGAYPLDGHSAQKDFCKASCRLRPAKLISCQLHLFHWQVCKAQGHDGAAQLDLNGHRSCYLDASLRKRLREECGVSGWTLLQFLGDAVLVPTGAPHQVQSLSSTISITQRFLSPENAVRSARLAAQTADPAGMVQRLRAQVRS